MDRTVVVTGASSGIGEATARYLAGRGWRVFAGVRRRSGQALPEGLQEVILDVTDPASLASAAEFVRSEVGEAGLHALVNNAGIGQVYPVEHVSAHDLQAIFAVNVFGLVACTQAFLPLLRAARGRIVNISSIGGLITIPFGGALCATKRAVDALSDAMRLELLPAGIHVIAIRPASIHSPAADKLAADPDALVASLPPEGRDRYGDLLRHFLSEMQESENAGSPPEVVAHTIETALEARNPHTTYLTGKDAPMLEFMGRWVPDHLRDRLLLSKLGLPHEFGGEG